MNRKVTPKRVTLTLSPERAAALCRFMDKMTFAQAREVLYPHVPADLREDQAYEIVHACSDVHKALTDAGVSGWPWVETGHA
jgi:hypothetical protein